MPEWSQGMKGNTVEARFSNKLVNFGQMTVSYVKQGLRDPVEILQKFNILNPLWSKINLVRMGY